MYIFLTTRKRELIITSMTLLVLCIGVFVAWRTPLFFVSESQIPFTSYFTYPETYTDALPKPKLLDEFSFRELTALDERVFALVSEEKLSATNASRLYVYLMTAEHDAFMLASKAGSTHFTLAPLVKEIICEFLREACAHIVVSTDAYSQAIAAIVMTPVRARRILDESTERHYPFTEVYQAYWDSTKDYAGTSVGSWKTWHVTDVVSFREKSPPLPESDAWQAQIQDMQTTLANLTDAERSAALEETVVPGTGTVSAGTIKYLTGLQQQSNTSLERILFERMVMTQAIMDAQIVGHDSKYTYWYPRPNVIDPNLKPLIATPQNPSYPSTGVAAEVAGSVLMQEWYKEDFDAIASRLNETKNAKVNAGIHSRGDVEAGTRIGKAVADIYISR